MKRILQADTVDVLSHPQELKTESYERRPNVAVFDRVDLVVSFRPGRNGIGAIVHGFLDAIKVHDEVVAKIELCMNTIEELRLNYRRKNRLFRNLDSAWNTILDNPVDYHEYLRLLPQMEDIEGKIDRAEDPVAKFELESMYSRFKQLDPLCSKQLQLYNAYAKARDERDDAVKVLVAAEKELQQMKEQEKLLSLSISDDHILADEMSKPLSIVFPNVQVGYILARINGENVEELIFEDVLVRVRRARSPHNAVFLRYDYRFDPFCGVWRSLQELRDMGVCVEDPLLQKMHFISVAAQGDAASVEQLLLGGEDPNAVDLTGNSVLVAAATSMRTEVVKLLYKAGANINITDKNMMTPLLYCANRGQLEMVRLLLDLGADRSHTDRNLRGPLFYSILSENLSVVKQFFKLELKDFTERLWGFTPLHLAANQGSLPIVDFLLSQGCSIYKMDKRGRTPEDIARECRHLTVERRLIDERFGAPGQFLRALALGNGENDSFHNDCSDKRHFTTEVWVGDVGAMDVVWCADVDITAVIYIRPTEHFPPHSAWLRKDRKKSEQLDYRGEAQNIVKFASFVINDPASKSDDDCWKKVLEIIPPVLEFIRNISKTRSIQKVVVCDETCRSLAPCISVAVLLLLGQVRIKDGIELLHKNRPGVELGANIMRGLNSLQSQLDSKLLRRMNAKARDSVVTSVSF